MAWNEPGKSGQGGNQDGPPDLDKVFKDIGDKFSGLFGKKKTSSNGGSSAGGEVTNLKPFIIGGVIVALLIWALSGIFIVSPAERSVVLQFGQYRSTVGPGPHWIPRFIQSETTVNVQNISNYSYSAQMLTTDQNIVDVAVAVQYRISDAKNYLYNLVNANDSVQQATASALRQVIGHTTLDQVLTSGRAVVRQDVLEQVEKILQLYHAGIEITDVALQPARAPAEVKDAFDDAIKAQEDEQRYQNQAEAYANSVVPIAQGKAKRIGQEADAYAKKVVLQSKGAVAQFNAVYAVYKNAPTVTRERMYIETIEKVLEESSKVFIDTKGNNNLMYLPLDKLIGSKVKDLSNSDDDDQTVTSQDLTDSGVLRNTDSSEENNLRAGPYANPDSTVGQGVRP